MSTKILAREKMLRRRLRRLHKLYDTALAYVLSLNAEYVLNHMVKNVGEIMALDHCYVMLVNHDTGRLTMQARWQAPAPTEEGMPAPTDHVDESSPAIVARLEGTRSGPPPVEPLPWAGTLETLVVGHMSPMIIPDTATFPDLRLEVPEQPLPASMVAIPLTFRDKVIGTLTVASTERRTFEPEEVVALSQLATPASMSIENERLYTSLRERLREKEALLEGNAAVAGKSETSELLSTMARQMARVMQDAWCGLFLCEDGFLHLRAQATWEAGSTAEVALDGSDATRHDEGDACGRIRVADSPWAQAVLDRGERLSLPERDASDPLVELARSRGTDAASLVPILRQDSRLGLALVTLRRPGDEFREGDYRILVALANQAAMALTHARLVEDERRQGEQRTVLLEAARLAASSLNMMGTLDGFAELCARCLGADRALIFEASQGQTLELSAAYGIDPQQEMDFVLALPLHLDRETVCRQAIESGQGVFHDIRSGSELGPSERMLATSCDAQALSAWPLCSPRGMGVVLLLFTTPPRRQQMHLDTMDGVTRQMGVFLQNTCLFEEVRLRAEQMKAISDITEAINATHDLPSIFSIVARNTQRVVPSDWTGLALVEPDKKLLRLLVRSVRGDLHKEEALTFPLDESLVHHATADGRPLICDSLVGSRSAFEKYLHDEGLRSLLIVPLVVEHKTVATLNLASRRPSAFTSNQVEILQHMADHLATAIKNANMFEEITRMNQELRRMDEVKSDFLSTVAHELRTPLTIIKGYLFILLRPQGLTDFVTETLETIDSQTDHLKELIENLLSLSKLEANKGVLAPNMQAVRMAELVDEVVGNFKLTARKKGVELKTDVAPDIVLKADRVMLVRVLYNLVGNALKFTHDGRISISVRQIEGGRMICEIEDTGSGIAPEHLSRIFERFYHVDAKDQRAPTGTGLGLAIVESIVHAHGGRVWVTSELGKGTRITFVLPLQPTGVPVKP